MFTQKEIQDLKIVFNFEVGNRVYATSLAKEGEVKEVVEKGFNVKLDGNPHLNFFLKNSEENFYTSVLRPVS